MIYLTMMLITVSMVCLIENEQDYGIIYLISYLYRYVIKTVIL